MQSQQAYTPLQEAQPLVTFIITCYNLPSEMLVECIDSILALSLSRQEREIIVVDDGSDVSPVNDLLPYGDEIVYLRKPNGGVSTARNMGLRSATGRFIQFVDGDDCLLKEAYEHCLDIVRRDDTDIVAFDFTHEQSQATPTEPATPAAYEDWPSMSGSELMRKHNLRGAAWLCIFRCSILGELTFTPGISYGEDEEFTPQLFLRAEKVVRTSACAYYYRERNTSAIGDKTPEGIRRRLDDNLQVIVSLKRKAATMPTAERIAMERRVAQLSMDYLYNTIMLTHDSHQLSERIEAMRGKELYPLPSRNYTTKYIWFRRLANSRAGLKILMRLLPLMKKER